ncbi:uncharacterized protein N0V89_000094 [Didymosphaeria variabile]|uniref:Dynactin subunit 6 n=1 Tax=Didymosphaeria variabile TaxID=1932322 RepID=A0A9W9CFD0_9PLEO|nr:uncharacterized protein N0V89_000094 [Didymosphaeria variabile]KAJ4359539.1 hypothetical protein N0V89_000094 [Didymosphaeria variabile]
MSAQPTPSRPDGARRTSAMNKRTSILPKHNALFIDPSVLVAQHASFTGTQPITVGPNAVLHPHAKVSSTLAPVVIGENVVLWERAKIGVGMGDSVDESKRSSMASMSSRTSVRDSSRGEGTVLGRNVTVEATAVVEAAEVGEGTIIEVGAYVGKGCVIGKVRGDRKYRQQKTLLLRPEVLEMRTNLHTMQINTFKRLVPNQVAKWAS